MTTRNPGERMATPSEGAESEEQEVAERMAREREAGERTARREPDDAREEEGWTQPESSAQKGAERDDSEG